MNLLLWSERGVLEIEMGLKDILVEGSRENLDVNLQIPVWSESDTPFSPVFIQFGSTSQCLLTVSNLARKTTQISVVQGTQFH